jgi:glycogen(starch) synthase
VETFSNATLEAMAMGCPIVSARVGGMEEMLRWGGGLTYPPGDVAALTQSLCDLLNDPARLARMSSEARHAAVTHFSWSQMVTEMEACIQRVSSSPPGSPLSAPISR